MRRTLPFALLVAFGWRAVAATATISSDCTIDLGFGARLGFALFETRQGACLPPVNAWCEPAGAHGRVPWKFVRWGKAIAMGTTSLGPGRDGMASVRVDFSMLDSFACSDVGWRLVFSGDAWKKWMPPKPGKNAKIRAFEWTCPDGNSISLHFGGDLAYRVDDRRKDGGGGEIEIRFFQQKGAAFRRGDSRGADVSVAAGKGAVKTAVAPVVRIAEGSDWVRYEPAMEGTGAKDVKKGSALDFSRVTGVEPNAGRHGPLVVANGAFAPRNRPNSPVRFYGATLPASRATPEREAAKRCVNALVRGGMNALRITEVETLTDKDMPKFDDFLNLLAREGVSVTFDLDVARETTWLELGLPEPPGEKVPPRPFVKALTLVDDRAFALWRERALGFLERKSRVNGRRYADNPAIPFVTTAAQGGAFAAWHKLRGLPAVQKSYAAWRAAKAKADPAFGRDAPKPADLPWISLHAGGSDGKAVREFLAELEGAGVRRKRAAVASLHGGTLAAEWSVGPHYAKLAQTRAATGDFTCGSFAIDAPVVLGEGGKPPWSLRNANPLDFMELPSKDMAALSLGDRPFCLLAWQAPAPNRARAMAGLWVGAVAAREKWGALFRGPWTAVEGDPLARAGEYAAATLFLRGDGAEKMRLDVANGALTVETARTAGGYSPSAKGTVAAGPLTAALSGAPATVFAISLGRRALADSPRILVAHLTDAQRTGTVFADARRRQLLRLGAGPRVIAAGTAEISLALTKPMQYRVWALGSDGTRLERIPHVVKNGELRFTADVRGSRNAYFLYEVTL